MKKSKIRIAIGFVGVATLLASCAAMTVGGYRVHSSTARPGDLESYPHVTYEDREAYLLGSEWYYRDATYGLVVFDEEPPPLKAYRERTYATKTRAVTAP